MTAEESHASDGPPEIDEKRPGTLPCPVCGVPMHVEVKQHVEVDVCEQHGIWLDKDELDGIAKAIRARTQTFERALRRVAVDKAKQSARIAGANFGFWALLFH
jgi:Zn-finger nucleic acid-binding protein